MKKPKPEDFTFDTEAFTKADRDYWQWRAGISEKELNRFHNVAHDIAGESFLNWRAQLQEECSRAREALNLIEESQQ